MRRKSRCFGFLNNRFGFTLIELMIVVSVVGILAAIAIPKFADMVRRAKEGSIKASLGAIRSALNIYYAANEGVGPTTTNALTVNSKYLDSKPSITVIPYHQTWSPLLSISNSNCLACDQAALNANIAANLAFDNGTYL